MTTNSQLPEKANSDVAHDFVIGQRLKFAGPGVVTLEPFEVASPATDQILIETAYSAVSPGTELAVLDSRPNSVTAARGYPFYPGYSNVGVVKRVGAKVVHHRVGDWVATTGAHQSHFLLPDTQGPGAPPDKYRDSFASSYNPGQVGSQHLIWKLPKDPSTDLLLASSLFKIAVVGLGGIRRSRMQLGENVLVIGLGPIGLSALRFARLGGADFVIAIDPVASRQARALQCGADHAFSSLDEFQASGLPAPRVVIDATGSPDVIPRLCRVAAHRGSIVIAGIPRGVTSDLNLGADFALKNLTLCGMHEINRRSLESAEFDWTLWDDAALILGLTARGKIDLAPLIGPVIGLDSVCDVYELLRSNKDAMVPIIKWQA